MQESAKDEKKMNRKERRRLQRERAQTTQENGSGAGRDIDRSSSKKQRAVVQVLTTMMNCILAGGRQKLREKRALSLLKGSGQHFQIQTNTTISTTAH